MYDDRRMALSWIVRIIYMVPAAVFYLLVHIARRFQRWYTLGLAESWPAVDATVGGSYELDENQTPFSRNAWFEEDDEYYPRWAVALLYDYQANGERYSGTYFLPNTFSDGDLASEAEKAWIGRKIVVRYNPSHPARSLFLQQDGAPGKPHIPRLISYRPYVTDLSLK